MPANTIVTTNLKRFTLIGLLNAVDTSALCLYLGTGDGPWANDAEPPAPEDTMDYKRSIWNSMSGILRLNSGDVSPAIKRINWQSGTVYEKYDVTNTNLGTGTGYYVLAGRYDRDVYKCLDNNADHQSLEKPVLKNTSVIRSSDGYVWKYMYSITDDSFRRFATDDVIPVYSNPLVASVAVDGTILNVTSTANVAYGTGINYRGSNFSNGTVGVALTNATIFTTVSETSACNVIRLQADSGLSATDDFYNNCGIYITSGISTGVMKTISDYDAGSNTVVLETAINNIANGDTFMIGPKIDVINGHGKGFKAIGDVSTSGRIRKVITINSGRGYTNASLTAFVNGRYATSPHGTSAKLSVNTTPFGGHGYYPVSELDAKYFVVSSETTFANRKNEEQGAFIGPSGKIRQAGLLMTPDFNHGLGQTFDQRLTFFIGDPIRSGAVMANFSEGKIITNANTGGTARIFSKGGESQRHTAITDTSTVAVPDTTALGKSEFLTVTDVHGEFSEGDQIYIGSDFLQISHTGLYKYEYPQGSGFSPVSAISYAGVTKYIGEILYHENISQISRRDGQRENFKFVFEI